MTLANIGNHDITLDETFYEDHWRYFHNQGRQDSEACRALLRESTEITYLQHESAHVKLTSPHGPQTHFKVFGSPFSPAHGLWAFGYKPKAAATLWDAIPLDSDIVITHTPPRNHCDISVTKARQGCEFLRQALWRVRPRLSVCGHMHEGRGAERVKWHLSLPSAKYLEESVDFWVDSGAGQGNKKQSLVNLTERSANKALNNMDLKPPRQAKNVSFSGEGAGVLPTGDEVASLADLDSYSKKLKGHLNRSKKKATIRGLAERSSEEENLESSPSVSYSRLNDEGFEAAAGNVETCIVNAAILANSWGGPKRFNKPIVVDLELPVWRGDGQGNGSRG